MQSLSDAGHILQVFNERGHLVKTAHAEVKDQAFQPIRKAESLFLTSKRFNRRTCCWLMANSLFKKCYCCRTKPINCKPSSLSIGKRLVAGKITSVLVRAQLLCVQDACQSEMLEKLS